MNKSSVIISLSALVLFAVSAMAQTKVVIVPLGGKKATGDAVAADVLEGKTFSNKDDVDIAGAMVNRGAMTFTPGTEDQNVPEGYHNGSGTVTGDTNLTPDNIKLDSTIFGETGTFTREMTDPMTAGDLLSGKVGYVNGERVTGTISAGADINGPNGALSFTITDGLYNGNKTCTASDTNFTPANIKYDLQIFGQTGTFTEEADNPMADANLLSGKVGFVNGAKVTGTMPTQTLSNTTTTVPGGYYTATDLVTVDSNLVASNICLGVTIFGITGTGASCIPTVTTATGRVWMDRNLGASQVATSLTDANAYGDLYQWGRLTDGHEKRGSGLETLQSPGDVPGHGNFIYSNPDWRNPGSNLLWQGVSGANNPCPAEFRIPTNAEWQNEIDSWGSNTAAAAFASPLHLTYGGYRDYTDGGIKNIPSNGAYQSADVTTSPSSSFLYITPTVNITPGIRGYGLSVRCIKD